MAPDSPERRRARNPLQQHNPPPRHERPMVMSLGDKCITGLILFCVLFALGLWIGLPIINDARTEHIPNRSFHSADLTGGWYSVPREYMQDDCIIKVVSLNNTLNHRVDLKCDNEPVLSTFKDLNCDDVDPLHDHISNWCFKRMSCQNDTCKYNCRFTRTHYKQVNISVSPSLFHIVGRYFDYSTEWINPDVNALIDSNGHIPSFAPPVAWCSYKLGDNNDMTELYFNRRGSYMDIHLQHLMTITITVAVIMGLVGAGWIFVVCNPGAPIV